MTIVNNDLLLKIIKTHTLSDGTEIGIGFAGPEDEQRLVRGFNKLSLQTRLYRFHYGKFRLTEQDKHYLLHIDNYNHLALGAVDLNGSPDIGIGLIRYIRDKDIPSKAECAITVIDEYQNRGIGTLLYNEMLPYARKNKISVLMNYVMKENVPMIKILKKLDYKIVEQLSDHFLIEVNINNKSNFNPVSLSLL